MTIKAFGYTKSGKAGVFEWLETAEPQPGPRDLIVRVKAVSVNPVDVKARAAATPENGTPRILGFDAAGVVERVGNNVTLFSPGEEVFYPDAIDRPGTNVTLRAVEERIVGRKPTSLSWTDAADLPLTALTAWELLLERTRVSYGAKTAGGTLGYRAEVASTPNAG
ncbi:alcohol dehydrogenase-like protein [Rhizobium sp. PP-F2F-G38]|nr:alcohol dehydrogenase-like protein [Rhizobium sp. PP-F2F-G38]